MSRLIVKGLPKRYDEKLVRDLFSCGGDVTDAKVMRTADGRSRQFAFVGFHRDADAKKAMQLLDRTYVDSSQVSVQVARPVGDDSIPRPWSKYSKGSSLHDGPKPVRPASGVTKRGRTNAGLEGTHSKTPDPTFELFKDVAGKRGKKSLWADDLGKSAGTVKKSLVQSRKAGGEGVMLERKHVVFDAEASDDGSGAENDALYEDIPQLNKTNADSTSILGSEESTQNCESTTGDKTACDGAVDDDSYLESKMRANLDNENDSSVDESCRSADESELDSNNLAEHTIHEKEANTGLGSAGSSSLAMERVGFGTEGRILETDMAAGDDAKKRDYPVNDADASETGRLFVRNLAYSVNEDDLEHLFEKFGTISDIHIVQDHLTKKSRGVAFVLFVVPEDAVKAMQSLDGTVFSGRLLHILPGKPRPQSSVPGRSGQTEAPGSNAFKEARDAARKESARTGSDAVAYNAMYMSADAVADVMADRYGVPKADVLGTGRGESGSAAVRLAAGEARLQAETQEFFMAHGINLSVAQAAARDLRAKRRSRTAFLVKNLPAQTAEEDLRRVFAAHGALEQLLVVPTGLLAVVVYQSANDAKKAYSVLAYTRMKDTPLYLEWLPMEALVNRAPREDDESRVRDVKVKAESETRTAGNGTPTHTAEDDGVPVEAQTVYVKNLNFDTRENGLRSHFAAILWKQARLSSAIRSATVATKPNPKDPSGPRLSYGYGFVEFDNVQNAKSAAKLVQGTVLDGHTLDLKLSTRSSRDRKPNNKADTRKGGAVEVKKKTKPSAKLVVRNLAFEATLRDVRQLFETFGQLKTARIPRRPDGKHRGFGFVEFVSKNEAASACHALGSTHLYGRHLVIEYADESSMSQASLQDLQERAGKHVAKRRRIEAEEGTDKRASEEGGGEHTGDSHAQVMDELYA